MKTEPGEDQALLHEVRPADIYQMIYFSLSDPYELADLC